LPYFEILIQHQLNLSVRVRVRIYIVWYFLEIRNSK